MRIILAILFIGSGLVQAQTNYNGKVIWDWRKSPAAHNKSAQVIQETGMTKTQTIYLRAQQRPEWEGWYVSDQRVGTGATTRFLPNQTQTVRIERVGKTLLATINGQLLYSSDTNSSTEVSKINGVGFFASEGGHNATIDNFQLNGVVDNFNTPNSWRLYCEIQPVGTKHHAKAKDVVTQADWDETANAIDVKISGGGCCN